jgi:hypothetical protein
MSSACGRETECFRPVYDPGIRINDHSFIRHEGRWHLFHIWLPDPEAEPEHAQLDSVLGHATAFAVDAWQREPDILPREPPPSWESQRGGNAPYVYESGGLFYLFYSRYAPSGHQAIGLATSAAFPLKMGVRMNGNSRRRGARRAHSGLRN